MMYEHEDALAMLIKIGATYGHFFISAIFIIAAGILWYRMKTVATGMFFCGLLLSVAISFSITTIISFHLLETAVETQSLIQKLSGFAFLTNLVQVVGFFIFVIDDLPNRLGMLNKP